MMLIVAVMIFVPLQTGKLSEIYNSTNQYQRARYSPTQVNAHVIITGVITPSSIIDFCRDYFANDPTGHVVVLASSIPTMEIRQILRHPFYKSRLFYLCGSSLNVTDLIRCSASQATGVFFLNSEGDCSGPVSQTDDQVVDRGADESILMQVLVCKTKFAGLSIFAQVSDIRSQDLALSCGSDRVVCIDELKMSLLAKNCLVPGLLTFIMNLVHGYQDDTFNTDQWKKEYHEGALNDVLSFRFPPGLVNKPFNQVALALYSSFGITLLGIVGKHQKITLSPHKSYVISNNDLGLCIAFGGDEAILRISVQFNDPNSQLNNALMALSAPGIQIQSILKSVENLQETSYTPSSSGFVKVTSSGQAMLTVSSPSSPELPVGASPISPFKKHVILCATTVSARAVRHFIKTVRTADTNTGKEAVPILCLVENLPTPSDSGSIWDDILAFDRVYVVKGTPLKKSCLINAGIESCFCTVILAAKTQCSDDTIPDSNSIFIVQMIQEVFFLWLITGVA